MNPKEDFLDVLLDEHYSGEPFLGYDSPTEVNTNGDASAIKRQKPVLKCVVCDDHAFGYNFDAVSCESCKAFFRRNALRPPGKLKCRVNGHCEVTVEKRKRCKKCRLDKCFRMGMRKEWILSEEEKRKKRSKIEENRRRKQPNNNHQAEVPHPQAKQPSVAQTDDQEVQIEEISPMFIVDWSRIHQIQSAYTEAIALNKVVGVPPYPATQPIHSALDLLRIPTYLASIRLISYIKKIPEFDLFHPEDRVTLVKHNLLAVVFTHIVLLYDPIADTYHEYNTSDPIFQGKDWIEVLGETFYHELTTIAMKLIEIVQYDRVIVKIFLLLILFSKGFCAYDIEHEPTLKNHSIVIKTQNSYLTALYKYSLHHYGARKTVVLLSRSMSQLLAIQRLAVHLKYCVHNHIDASQLSPLMQTVLQLND